MATEGGQNLYQWIRWKRLLLTWWCPLGQGKGHLPAREYIIMDRLILILTPLSSHWTVPLKENIQHFKTWHFFYTWNFFTFIDSRPKSMRIRIHKTGSKSKSYQSEVIVGHLCRNPSGNSVEVKYEYEGRMNHTIYICVFLLDAPDHGPNIYKDTEL
jgi:hypothetical protein